MVEVIDFPKTKDYKILFALPPGGKVRINKTSEDIELEITKNYGTAFIKAKSLHEAKKLLYSTLPTCEIVDEW